MEGLDSKDEYSRHYGSIIARYFPRIETFIASRMEVRSLIDYWKYIVFLDIYIFFFPLDIC